MLELTAAACAHHQRLATDLSSSSSWTAKRQLQGSKFKFEFGSTCATRCKFLGAWLKILGAQLIMMGASLSKEKVKSF